MSLPGVRTKQNRTSVLLSVFWAVQANQEKWIDWNSCYLRITEFELLHLAHLSVAGFNLFNMLNAELLEWSSRGRLFWVLCNVACTYHFSLFFHRNYPCQYSAVYLHYLLILLHLLFWLMQIHNSHQLFLRASHYSVLLILQTIWL